MTPTNLLKICGINQLPIAQCAVDGGADFLGFIFCKRSPRYVTAEQASEIIAGLHGREKCRFVGVFRDADEEEIRLIGRQLKLDVIQIHGAFPAVSAMALQREFQLWKAVSSAEDWSPDYPADAFLVDASNPGSGTRSDWRLAENIRNRGKKVVRAGGLSIANLQEAAALNCYVLDVNSSLEDAPGQKSLQKTCELMAEYRKYCRGQ